MRCTRSPACFGMEDLSSGLGDRCRYAATSNNRYFRHGDVMPDGPQIQIRIATDGNPDILKEGIEKLLSNHNVECDLQTKYMVQKSIEPATGGIVIATLAFGAALLPFLTELLKFNIGSESKPESQINIENSNIQVNNYQINLDQKSIESIATDDKLNMPPELLETIIANLPSPKENEAEEPNPDS